MEQQFNDIQFFMYPPFNRDHTWHKDYDYEIPVISSVGNGPKGDKGDSLTFEDLTSAQKAQLKGEKGDKGDDGQPLMFEDLTQEQWDFLVSLGLKGDPGEDGQNLVFEDLTEEQWAQLIAWGLKGDKGDRGDDGADGSFEMLTPEQQEQVIDYIGARVAELAIVNHYHYVETPVETDETNPVSEIVIEDIGSVKRVEDFLVIVSGLVLVPGVEYTTISSHNVSTDTYTSVIVLNTPIVHPSTKVCIRWSDATWVPIDDNQE